MALRYSYAFPSSAPAQNQAHFGVKGAAANSQRFIEWSMSGLGTSSASNEISWQLATGTLTLTNAVTARAANSANTVAATTTGGYPSTALTSGNEYGRFGVNSNGAMIRWVNPPGTDVEIRGNATALQVAWKNVSTTPGSLCGTVWFDDI